MFTQLHASKIVVGLLAIIGGYLVLGGVAGATPLKIDFTEGGNNGTLQAGYQEFMHNTDGGGLVTKPLLSDMGIGGTVDVSIWGNTHWRSYAEATGIFAPQSALCCEMACCATSFARSHSAWRISSTEPTKSRPTITRFNTDRPGTTSSRSTSP